MDPALDKKRLDKLARVRENQRKSRARKQDHIRDLEEKVVSLQKEAHHKDVEHRLAVQKLEAENQKLRDILTCSGVPVDALELYLRSVHNPVAAQKIAIPALPRPAIESGAGCQETTTCVRPLLSPLVPTVETPVQSSPERPLSSEVVGDVTERESGKSIQESDASICACLPGESIGSLPISDEVLNTTLCVMAERLIDQYNTRGLDISEIRQKLRAGFSRSLKKEGCRVQNQILFQVLDEISSD